MLDTEEEADEEPGDEGAGGPRADENAPAPPVSWSKEEKALFGRLPPDVQAAIARREAERERYLTARTQETARRERELGDERARVQSQLALLLAQAEADPVLAEGRRLDWERLRRQDPASFARKWPAFQTRLAAIEQARDLQDAAAAPPPDATREMARLAERAPELADPAHRRSTLDAINSFLQGEGFAREQIGELVDHRIILLARDAMRWREQERTKRSAAAKKVAQAPRTQKPGSADEGASRAERLARLKRKAAQSGKIDDRAAYVLAALDEGEEAA